MANYFGVNANKFYGVGIYILAVWILYGRKEVLPKDAIKGEVRLSEAKRDPKAEQDFAKAPTLARGGSSGGI